MGLEAKAEGAEDAGSYSAGGGSEVWEWAGAVGRRVLYIMLMFEGYEK